MLKWLGSFIDSNEKELKNLQSRVARINAFEAEFESLSDDELRAKTEQFKRRLAEATSKIKQQLDEAESNLAEVSQHSSVIEKKAEREDRYAQGKLLEERVSQLQKEQRVIELEALNELLPEAFTAVREAARRTMGQRHFDVQLMGGIVLHQGKIAEMKTGEGKTLVATLPVYLNSLTGRGCHLVTVNDYLAKRDHHWMGAIYHALGVSVASIQHEAAFIYDPEYKTEDERWNFLRPASRREAYQADITYGTNNEFGFDYLRDNMIVDLSQCVQRPLNYAIVDEVDNILIDEARTPLIISGSRPDTSQEYQIFARIARQLQPERDYKMSEKGRSVDEIYESGYETSENILRREGVLKSGNLYDYENASLLHHLRNAITAKESYHRDREYVVREDQVIIVDEFTGRLMMGRRFSEGLHQAIEAKEGVKVQHESLTYATVTLQNYFRMYSKLAGMTGTAVTEAEEFHKIYKLEVVVIDTNEPMIRQDSPDRIYKDESAKFKAVVNELEQLHRKEQPVLTGTVSIEKSEILSAMLKKKGIPHQVLNAKNHEKEASIIAQAGRMGAVTVATNMAGRGVDIVLGGNPEGRDEQEWRQEHQKVIDLGGLVIIGTERHEARRIDNQLRGRSGRQGDPGQSRFYVSLADDTIKRFGGDRIKGIMEWAGLDEDTPIENRLVNRAIEGAQVKVEGYHFDIRKNLVEYDDVVNIQREIIYSERKKILSGADLKANILDMLRDEIGSIVASHIKGGRGADRDIEGLSSEIASIMPLPPDSLALFSDRPEEIEEKLFEQAEALYEQREQELGSENMRVLERLVMLRTIDNLWIEHLTTMEEMRLEAGWQTLRQVKAADAYKNKGFEQFQILLDTIRYDIARAIFHVGIIRQAARQPEPSPMARVAAATANSRQQGQKAAGTKIGRNEPCPCGSGKKYKLCHGK
ncbi:MAG: preprotein translocase subunit SecA [Dehalococcoidales bacterium]|nr:preprotein translocase subunit SecA [Dehalococcoidales bacterium]